MNGLKRWKKDLGLMALLYVLVLILYRDVAFWGKMFLSADTIAQGAVFGKFWFQQLSEHHRYPLWYPHIFSGMPFFASMSFVFVYPIRILLHYLDQFGLHFLHYKITHFFLGGLFTYLLMRSYKLKRASAFVAAAVFIFSPMIASLEHGNRIITIMYIPVVFYMVRRLFLRRDLTSLAWAGLAIGFQMMANHLQIVYYTWLFLGLFFLSQAFSDIRKRRAAGHIIGRGGLLVGGLIIGLGVAAILLLSVYQYTPYSARGSGDPATAYQYATNWSLHPQEMVTFLIPSFMGFGGQTYWGYMPFTHCPNYVGIVALFLAVWALIFHRNRTTIFFAVVGCLAILVSYGRFFPILYKPLYHLLPFFGKFRAPAMILMLLFFSIAVLAGFGVQALLEWQAASDRHQRERRWRRILLILVLALLFAGLLLFVAQGPFSRSLRSAFNHVDASMGRYAQIAPQAREQLNDRRLSMVLTDIWKMILFLAAAGLFVFLYLGKKIGQPLLTGLLVSLVVLDLFWVDLKVVHFEQPRGYEWAYYRGRRDEIVRFLEQDRSLYRILPLDDVSTNEYAYFDISSVGGYHPAKLGIYQKAMEKLGLGNPNLIDLLNVKYLITRRQIDHPRFEKVLETSSGSIYQNKAVMPRAFLVSQTEVIEHEDELFARLASEEFDPSRTALLEKEASLTMGPVGDGTVQVVDYESGRIRLEARVPNACLLVLSEIYYPAGWRAYVDGEKTEIYRANGLLRAICLPQGNHEISILFRPWTFRAGLWISAFFLLGILVTVVFGGLRGSRRQANRKPRGGKR